MVRRRVAYLLALAVLLAGSLPLVSAAAVRPDWSRVDPVLFERLAEQGKAEFYVILAEQADLSGAAALRSKEEKTAYVYARLTRTARETQQPLLLYLQSQGAAVQSMFIQNMLRVEAGPAVLQWLAGRPEVARIVRPPEPRPDAAGADASPLPGDLPNGVEWNVARVRAPEVWDIGFRGEGIVVASLDTGVQYDHPALVNQYRGNLGGGTFDNNYNWWDCSGTPQFPWDNVGHGTHTTGTMVGDDGAGNQIGVAPGATWMACNGLDSCSPPMCFQFFLAPTDLSGQNPRPDLAPDVINNSWHDGSGFDYRTIIQNLIAAGIGVVKSAGNDGPDCHTINDPGYVPEVLTTGNSTPADFIASSSSRGPSDEYGEVIVKPEVAAPGTAVRSSVPTDDYGLATGTSMAAPHSTALVALLWEAAPCLRGRFAPTKELIMATADPVVDGQCPPFVEVPNDVWGWGSIDAYQAVLAALDYCGEVGVLDGNVSDAGTGAPIAGANVAAARVAGGQWHTTTDAGGAYTVSLLPGVYTVTASSYGYLPAVVTGTAIVTRQVAAQDFSLSPAPRYTLSGTCTVSGTGEPLPATVQVLGSPLPPVPADPAGGFYSLTVAAGAYTLRVTAGGYHRQERAVLVDRDQPQNFALTPLPCILLVDDDGDDPDTRGYYTSALGALSVTYDLWDLSSAGSPASEDLLGYRAVVWFTGQADQDTLNRGNEQALAAYLESGGRLLLSGQDYLWDAGVDDFGRDYLGLEAYDGEVGEVDMLANPGNPVGEGLGPYTLVPPMGWGAGFWTDALRGSGSPFRWTWTGQDNSTSYSAAGFRTVFLAWPLEGLPLVSDRAAVLGRAVARFGGCGGPCPPLSGADFSWLPVSPTVSQPVTFTAWASSTAAPTFTWDLGDGSRGQGVTLTHAYSLAGAYPATLTATNGCSTTGVAHTVTVVPAPCTAVSVLTVTASSSACVLTLTAGLAGTPPFAYLWQVAGMTSTLEAPTFAFGAGGIYLLALEVENCGGAHAASYTGQVTVECATRPNLVYLPLVTKGQGPAR